MARKNAHKPARRPTKLALALREARSEMGLTQRQFAKKIGMKAHNINQYEQSRARPQFETLRKIATALGKTLEELV
jgi:transcriptional regulator with XRE-family HTH domain